VPHRRLRSLTIDLDGVVGLVERLCRRDSRQPLGAPRAEVAFSLASWRVVVLCALVRWRGPVEGGMGATDTWTGCLVLVSVECPGDGR
jgi:hypothetical protein